MARPLSELSFRGRFREAQQRILDRSEQYLHDGKLHIVAAPGSGKTVLGLELIRRAGAPALIVSPSLPVRQQWGERFAELFLPEGERLEDYVSYSLDSPGQLCSVTYQALHAAGPDCVRLLKERGVGTVCLDEAHHLRLEWQKTLEELLALLGGTLTLISLTATPPYDATDAEWERYIRLCGPIDEEICVPELVKSGALCPHQDYVYLNTPSLSERALLADREAKAEEALRLISEQGLFEESWRLLEGKNEELLLENAAALTSLLSLQRALGLPLPERELHLLQPRGRLPAGDTAGDEAALELLSFHEELFGAAFCEKVQSILAERGLIERRRVHLAASERLQRRLLSSAGKLESVVEIARSELKCCGRALRMLVLTDHVQKNLLPLVGSNEPLTAMGAVSVFEALRRSCPYDTALALLSGPLVIVPNTFLPALFPLAEARGLRYELSPIPGTWHSLLTVAEGNEAKVALLTEALQQGQIHILVGTKALLGEGWDAPCLNSLVLASFVGSEVSTNQMRGRAIRRDREEPEKAANIWHLVTVLPTPRRLLPVRAEGPESEDLALLRRRFSSFMGLSYSEDRIESGLERVSLLQPPYDEARIKEINAGMLALAADRRGMARRWETALFEQPEPRVRELVRAEGELRPRVYLRLNNSLAAAEAAVFTAALAALGLSEPSGALLLLLPVLGYSGYSLGKSLLQTAKNLRPEQRVERLAAALLRAMQKTGLLSEGPQLSVKKRKTGVDCALEGAELRERELFAEALKELLSPLSEPRYFFVRALPLPGRLRPIESEPLPCPALFGAKREQAEALKKELERGGDRYELVYARSAEGRARLLRCRLAARETGDVSVRRLRQQ